jgi:hypothetical protein
MTSGGKAQLDPLWFGPFLNSEDVDEYFGIHFKVGCVLAEAL